MMQYWEIQSTAIDLLKARLEFTRIAATGIIADLGGYPKTEGVDEALEEFGLCLVVSEPIKPEFGDASLAGTTNEDVLLDVIIRYRAQVAERVGETTTHWRALDAARKAMQGQPASEPNLHLRFQADNPPWDYDGLIGGDNRVNAHFRVGHILVPT